MSLFTFFQILEAAGKDVDGLHVHAHTYTRARAQGVYRLCRVSRKYCIWTLNAKFGSEIRQVTLKRCRGYGRKFWAFDTGLHTCRGVYIRPYRTSRTCTYFKRFGFFIPAMCRDGIKSNMYLRIWVKYTRNVFILQSSQVQRIHYIAVQRTSSMYILL